jgi:hypothetical protein
VVVFPVAQINHCSYCGSRGVALFVLVLLGVGHRRGGGGLLIAVRDLNRFYLLNDSTYSLGA